MANIISLKRRIKAAQNVSKTTRAMQMIAASKLKRAQTAALSSRPYVEKLSSITQYISHNIEDTKKHPYIKPPGDMKKSLVIVLSPDKGLCGGLVTNLLREFLKYTQRDSQNQYIVVGKKLETKVAKLSNEVIASFSFGTITPAFDMVYPISKLINDYYLSQKVGNVKVLFTHFQSIFTQVPKIQTLLPIQLPPDEETKQNIQYLFEPKMEEMLPDLLKHYLEMNLYQFLVESFVSEQGSRMIAMQNATTNANDIIDYLRLEYNKSRQAKITNEILDLAGAQV